MATLCKYTLTEAVKLNRVLRLVLIPHDDAASFAFEIGSKQEIAYDDILAKQRSIIRLTVDPVDCSACSCTATRPTAGRVVTDICGISNTAFGGSATHATFVLGTPR